MKGEMYMCTGCISLVPGVKVLGTAPSGSKCVWCDDSKPRRVEVNMCDDYQPADWVTPQRPEGEPWYITGYLKNRRVA